MSEGTAELSADEQDKIAAYHKAMTDRQSGAVNVADRVSADAGMAATGEMPSAPMEPDRPAGPALPSQAHGAMPRTSDECRNRGRARRSRGRNAAPANESSLAPTCTA